MRISRSLIMRRPSWSLADVAAAMTLVFAAGVVVWAASGTGSHATMSFTGRDLQRDGEHAGRLVIPLEPSVAAMSRWQRPLADSASLFHGDRLIRFESEGPLPIGPSQHPRFDLHDGILRLDWPSDRPTVADDDSFELSLWKPPAPERRNALLVGLAAVAASALLSSGPLRGVWIAAVRGLSVCGPIVAPAAWLIVPMGGERWIDGDDLSWRLLRGLHDMAPAVLLLVSLGSAIAVRHLPSDAAKRHDRRSRCAMIRGANGLALAMIMSTHGLFVGWGASRPVIVDQTAYSAPFGAAAAFSDAQQYVVGAYHLAAHRELDEWSQRRPVNAAWYCARLKLSQFDLPSAAWLQSILLGLALAELVRETAWRYGGPCGLACLSLGWGMSRFFLVTAMAESLGFTLGAVGFAWLLRGFRQNSPWVSLLGLFALSLAQAARPGALLTLPALGAAWAMATIPAGRSLRSGIFRVLTSFATAAAVVVAGLAINPILNRCYGTGEGASGANFAYTVAGLASGVSWKEIEVEFRDELASLPNERAVANRLYDIGWRRFRERPHVLASELLRAIKTFAFDAPAVFTTMLIHAPSAPTRFIAWTIAGLWGLLAGSALCRLVRQCVGQPNSRREVWMWVALAMGLLASIPIVYLDGSVRVLVGTWSAVFVGLTLSLAPSSTMQFPQIRVRESPRWLWIRAAVLATGFVAACVAPYCPTLPRPSRIAQRFDQATTASPAETPHVDGTRVAEFNAVGPLVSIVPTGQAGFDRREFQLALQAGKLDMVDELLDHIPPAPFQFVQAYEGRTRRCWYVLRPDGADDLLFGDRSVRLITTPPPVALEPR